jgi:AcrR family transcriptional regulator
MRESGMTPEAPRRTGRPDQLASAARVRHIVDTAARLFIEQGYAATSLEQIAAAAGAGKQTLYRRFASKTGLFHAVIARNTEQLVEVARAAESAREDPVEALKESCRLMLDFMLQPDMISLHRILVAEALRFPELGEFVLETCMRPFDDLLKRQLATAAQARRIEIADLQRTFTLMSGLLTGWPVQLSLLGRQVFRTRAEHDAYFEDAWALFTRGVAGRAPA